MERTIRKLDELTISRIAAGEVVEGPASVVKELVENSIDAGASRIDVAIRQGGRTWIAVADDGAGIPSDQLRLAVERHATSKLDNDRSLAAISSLGFRGEALAAICSVARVTIVSRVREEADGRRLVIQGGRVVEDEPSGAPVGTRITVEHLFRDVPARLAFLAGDAAESGRVTDVVTRYALAYPDRRFTLERNDKRVFESPGRGGLKAAITAVLGGDIARDLIDVAYSESFDGSSDIDRLVRVRGAAGSAHVHRANRRGITLFVNGRSIKDARLMAAVVQAYRTRIPERRFPIAVLSIELPPDAVDVNVHPAKTEVRFKAPDRMFRVVRDAVIGALGAGRIGAGMERPGGAAAKSGGWGPSARLWRPPEHDATGATGAIGAIGGIGAIGEGRSEYGAVGLPDDGRSTAELGKEPGGERGDEVDTRESVDERSDRLPPLRVLGQIARCYIVAEGPGALYLIDQHAAHERVVFEALLARTGAPASQNLLEPLVVDLTPDESEAFERLGDELGRIGFAAERFGESAAIVRAIPEVLAGADPAGLFRDVLQSVLEDEPAVARAIEERLARAACKRGSVKAGQALSDVEIRALVDALERCDAPHTCPHGRPTVIVFEGDALERSFGRR